MSRGDIILRLVELTKVYYGTRKVIALNNISTSFKRGEFVAVVGRSGSGKSTLINILGGLDRPTSGDYYCEGNNVSRLNEGHWDALRNKKIGFIFQNYHLIEYLTVYENVEVALQFQNIPEGMKDAKIKDIVDKVGLSDHINKYPSQLSGGQRQRVAVARALVKDPDIILADEPTGALDWKTADEVIKLLKGESEDRLVVMVTHDRSIANKYANRIIEIDNGNFTQDLIKEEIEQTYQNVFRKIKPVTLRFRDKFIMTFNKIKSSLVRNFFIALSLALAFSFSVIFNGLDRGVRDSYYSYYDTLDITDSNSFSVVSRDDIMDLETFNKLNESVLENINDEKSEAEIVTGYSKDVIGLLYGYNTTANRIRDFNIYPDILRDTKIRLTSTDFDKYAYEDLFVRNSQLPLKPYTLMVTSKFIKEYYHLDKIKTIDSYIGKEIEVPKYKLITENLIPGVREFLNNSYEKDGEFYYSATEVENGVNIRFMDINVPYYCYNRDSLNSYYEQKCELQIKNNQLFTNYDAYITYMDTLKEQINNSNFYNLLLHSDALFYINHVNDPNYIGKVYRYIFNYPLYLENPGLMNSIIGYFLEKSETVNFKITGILDNDFEAIIYLTNENYNSLFSLQNGNMFEFIPAAHTIHYLDSERDRDTSVFEILTYHSYEYQDIELINYDKVENSTTCTPKAIINAKEDKDSILDSVFYVNDYKTCGGSNSASSYLNMTNNLFSLFFNILMIASVIFYSMLIKVIFKARINEIGVFRSVGSTIKDIKKLFFYEVIYIFTTATVLTIVLLTLVVTGINGLFLRFAELNSRVISFANVHLLISENLSIVNISYINLAFQIIIVVSLILYISNRNITKVVNTNPIDILREVV